MYAGVEGACRAAPAGLDAGTLQFDVSTWKRRDANMKQKQKLKIEIHLESLTRSTVQTKRAAAK